MFGFFQTKKKNKVQKRVTWALDKNIVHETFSSLEYDRHSIDSILYQKAYNRISHSEWMKVFVDLNNYKKYEMVVHEKSLQYINFHN